MWWNRWCGEMPCHRMKFAGTIQQPTCSAGSMPRRNEINYLLWHWQRRHGRGEKVDGEGVQRWLDGTRYMKQSLFHSSVSITNWAQTVQWEWLICGHLWIQNPSSSWYWQHCLIVSSLHVQFVMVGPLGEQRWWRAMWCRCPIQAPPWTMENIQLATRWW